MTSTAKRVDTLLRRLRENDELEALHEVTNMLHALCINYRDSCRLTRLATDHSGTISRLDEESERLIGELELYEPR